MILKSIYKIFSQLFIDPYSLIIKWRALPSYLINMIKYKRTNYSKFKISPTKFDYRTYEKFYKAGNVGGHYLLQDLWAAKEIYKNNILEHVDIGSRIDGFITHLLVFCKVIYVDIRDAESGLENLEFKKGSINHLPFESNSITSLSCLHVLEHIGLGRYGDPIDPFGYVKAADEIKRVLKKDGFLFFATPVGKEVLYFDAHRVFNPITIIEIFKGLTLLEFHLIDDKATNIIYNADLKQCSQLNYGCGLFKFKKEY